MGSKTIFLNKVQDAVMTLAQMQEFISGLSGVYLARGYQPGGTEPLTDADLTAAGIDLTAAQFNTIVAPLLGDYLSFCGNIALPAKDRKTDMNKVRRDI
jgi:hypothetical protein